MSTLVPLRQRSRRNIIRPPVIYQTLFVALAALMFHATMAAAPDAADVLGDFTLTSWAEGDGLPNARILSLAQDRDGYIWIGTYGGLVRFDGIRFQPIEAVTARAGYGKVVTALSVSTDGSLWAGFADFRGILRVQGHEVTTYRDAGTSAMGVISVLFHDRGGTLWAGGPHGLFRLDNESWMPVKQQDGLTETFVLGLHEGHAKGVCVITTGGVFVHAGENTFRRVTGPDSATCDLRRSASAEISAAGDTMAGSPAALLKDRRGNTWIGILGKGLWRTRRSHTAAISTQKITLSDGLGSEAVSSVIEDQEGNIWVGTWSGLHKLSPRRIDSVAGLGMVRVVERDLAGNVWVGTERGLAKLDEAGRSDYRSERALREAVFAIHADRHGTVWVATRHTVLRLIDGRFVPLAMPPGTRFARLASLATDSKDQLWIVDLHHGLFRWRDGLVTEVTTPDMVRERLVQAVYVDRADRVWVAFAPGALGLVGANGALRLYGPAEGLTGIVTAIYEDREGALWIGSNDGIGRFRDGRLEKATPVANGIPDAVVSEILEDAAGHLWIGTAAGLLRVHKQEFDRVRETPSHKVAYALYDGADGLLGTPLWLGTRSGIRTRDGRLWFVTGGGLAVVDPRTLADNRAPIPVRIESVSALGRTFPPSERLRLPPRSARIEIDYTGLTFASPTTVRFRYRLEGFDSAWVDAGTRRQALYTNLPPRSYRFRVTAIGKEGMQSASDAVLDFSIEPAVSQTWWFYLFCSAAGVLVFWTLWRVRLRQIQQQFALVLAERSRVSREIHDTLLQGVLGVALKFRSIEETVLAVSPIGEYLATIRRDLEEQICEARESIANLRSPTLEMYDLPTSIRQAGERITRDTPLQFRMTVSGVVRRLPPEAEEQLLRIGVEAVTNALRHASATCVQATLQYENQRIVLSIADDGCGFAHENVPDTCYGLTTMRERAERAGGHLTIESGTGRGTSVVTIIPTSRGGSNL